MYCIELCARLLVLTEFFSITPTALEGAYPNCGQRPHRGFTYVFFIVWGVSVELTDFIILEDSQMTGCILRARRTGDATHCDTTYATSWRSGLSPTTSGAISSNRFGPPRPRHVALGRVSPTHLRKGSMGLRRHRVFSPFVFKVGIILNRVPISLKRRCGALGVVRVGRHRYMICSLGAHTLSSTGMAFPK